MKSTILFAYLLHCVTLVAAIGFKGKIEGIPQVNELFKTRNKIVPNGQNYNNRIQVDLYPSDSFTPISTIIDSKYNFKFTSLQPGEYELIVNSYDFNFFNNRFKIVASDDSVVAYEHKLDENSYNVSSAVDLNDKSPLVINYFNTKEFYQSTGGSLKELLMNSPLGFIFRNRALTITFSICVAVMIAPYILKVVNPEFYAELNDIQTQVAKERIEKVEQAETPVKSTGVSRPTGAKQRR
ncbi:hypothetical protein Cantr_05488 [Candida viswanathii]|uniref:ER membrane protein complex subunit 7 beta-sandwich domain-containing protein n=1 Tax=Candida viswanathii TaxID=5486 RepID=A0A367XSE6_9ASCO|nr:hypothetical protein Cantr_05488 [Candida viswanathii]